jgi:hypothetical protein
MNLANVSEFLEPIFKRIFSSDLSHMKIVVVSLNMRDSCFASPEILAFVIEEFPNLKYLDISECRRITVEDVINVFSEFKDRHNENSTAEYNRRKLVLNDLNFNDCGLIDDADYWDDEPTAVDLVTINDILSQICEGTCILANSVCEVCETRILYRRSICKDCEENGSDKSGLTLEHVEDDFEDNGE